MKKKGRKAKRNGRFERKRKINAKALNKENLCMKPL